MKDFKQQLNKYSKETLIEYLTHNTLIDEQQNELLKTLSICQKHIESIRNIGISEELWGFYEIACQEKIDYLKKLESKYGKNYSIKLLSDDELNKLMKLHGKANSAWERYIKHEKKFERSLSNESMD